MLIGELARESGTTTKTLRFYEAEGLIPTPARTTSGYRAYDQQSVQRVLFIRDAQQAGFTLQQIRQILDIRDGGDPPCEHVRLLIEQRIGEVEQRMAELAQAKAHLHELARRTEQLDPADCGGYCDIIQQPS